MAKRKSRLVKRIIRVFDEYDEPVLCTRDIEEGLKNQLTKDGKRYTNSPTINELSNILKRHAEFKRTSDHHVIIREHSGSSYEMATWELTGKGRGEGLV